MESLTLTIAEFYSLFTLIFGRENMIKGFTNESHAELKESVKRKVNKIGETVRVQLTQIEEQRKKIQEYKEDGKADEDLSAIKLAKDLDLLNSKETIQVEKIPFSSVENISLSGNYQFLYDQIFTEK